MTASNNQDPRRNASRNSDIDHLFTTLRELQMDIAHVLAGQKSHEKALNDHMENEEKAIAALEARLRSGDDIMREMADTLDNLSHIQIAFPQDKHGKPDFIGHRMGHEQEIASEEDMRAVVLEGKKKVAGMVVEWFFRLLSLGMVVYIAQHVGAHT